MKKFIFAAMAALALSIVSVSAQEIKFQPGFQFGAGAGVTATPSADADFASVVGGPYAAAFIGYDFCAPLGVRLTFSYAGAKSSYAGASKSFPFSHAMAAADFVLDICNCFAFKETRVFNPYIGIGAAYDLRFGNTMTASDALKYNAAHLCTDNCRWWDGSVSSYAFRALAGADFRASDKVCVFVEFTDNLMTDRFNSLYDHLRIDQHMVLQAGVKFTFGQARKYAAAHAAAAAALAPAASTVDPAEAQRLLDEARKAAADAQAARDAADRARAEAEALLAQARAQVQQGITIAVSNPLFKIGKADLNDTAKANLKSLAEALKANPQVSINICGYADKQTGNPELNWTLSRKRAEAVLDALTYYGVPASQIHASWKGDTEAVSETQELNRTVTITIAE